MNNSYKKGDRVRIVAGKYKKNGYGIYLGKYGTVMCSIEVQGDSRSHRNIWLTSIKPIAPQESTEKKKQKLSDYMGPKQSKDGVDKEREAMMKAGQWTYKEYEECYKQEERFVKVAVSEMKTFLRNLEEMQEKMKEMSDKIDAHLKKDDDN
jgi:hypothetical protein